MYFDHARCPSCNTQFNPEKIVASGGKAACPSCGSALELKSLFGVADAFVGVGDDEGMGLGLDDLMKSHPQPGTKTSAPSAAPATEGGGALDLLRQIRDERD